MILKPTDLFSGEKSSFGLEDASLPEGLRKDAAIEELYIAPGLIDLQLNGYKGVDFNDEKLSFEKIEKAVYELLKDGVTGFLPTLITNDPRITLKNLKLFRRAIEKSSLVKSCILGIHLEGPFISSDIGAIGAHPLNWVQKPDFKLLMNWQKQSGELIKLVTMSPEYEGSNIFINNCVKADINVSIGHTNAAIEQIREAVQAGASLSTHLGNAIASIIHRHNNILFEQIANEELYASIITDGHHLPIELIKIILKTKQEKVFLVSDSTMFSGMPPGIYNTLIGGEVSLSENKRLSILGNKEYLAGSASSLSDCLNFLAKEKVLGLKQLWSLASTIPFNYLFKKNLPGIDEDSIIFSYRNNRIKLCLTRKNGQVFFPDS